MKILIISHEYPPIGGGGANACYFLAKEFIDAGHNVTIVTSVFRDMPKYIVDGNLRLIRVSALRKKQDKSNLLEMATFLCSAWWKLSTILKRESFDLCQVMFGIPSGPIAWHLKKRYHIPYVVRFGGGDIPGAQKRFAFVYKILTPFIRAVWREADYLIANSEGLKIRAQRFEHKYPIKVIPNGVDFEFFKSDSNKKKSEHIEILFVSRLIEGKGLQYVIPFMKKIEESVHKAIQLTIVGDGPYRSNLEMLTAENGVEELVAFEGRREALELLSYYQRADFFILPSKSEGMPNVVLEAMACGLPVLMTPCEGSVELIHGNGIISNIETFVENIILLSLNHKMRCSMGEKSREAVEQNFSWNQVASEYMKLYKYINKKL